VKAILEFNVDGEQEEFQDAVNGWRNKAIVDEIWQRCFRGNNKHGYNHDVLNSAAAYDVIEKLAEIYQDILSEYRNDN